MGRFQAKSWDSSRFESLVLNWESVTTKEAEEQEEEEEEG